MRDIPTAPTAADGPRGTLVGLLLPGTDPRMSRWGSLAVFAASFVVAVLRLGRTIGADMLWAEDGRVFLGDQLGAPFLEVVGRPYADYLHVVPRVLTRLVTLLPVADAAVAMSVAAALVQASAASVGYVVVRAHARHPAPALLVAGAVAFVPLGPEAALNIANAQWFLMFASLTAMLWTPRGWPGRSVQLALGLGFALSSPFGLVLVGLSVCRVLLTRSAWDGAVAAAVTAATVLQLWAISQTGTTRARPALQEEALGIGYLRRVVSDGVLGVGRLQGAETDTGLAAPLAVGAVFLILCLLKAHREGWLALLPTMTFLVLSWVTYAIPVALTGLPATNPGFSGRYYVAPALLWVVALTLTLPAPGASTASAWTRGIVYALVVGVLVWGWATSYPLVKGFLRVGAPSWSVEVANAQRACASLPLDAAVQVPIAPTGWSVTVPCRAVR